MDEENNDCLFSCPIGYFREGNECEKCSEDCKTCVNPLDRGCTSCKTGFNFKLLNRDIGSGVCNEILNEEEEVEVLTTCPFGYFLQEETNLTTYECVKQCDS